MGAMAIVVCMVDFKKENVGLAQANNYISNSHDVTMGVTSRCCPRITHASFNLGTPSSVPRPLRIFTHHRAQRKDHPEIS